MSTEQQPDTPAAETPAADITQQVTSPEPKTQPTKNPKRVAAGRMVAERTKKACEEQKKAASKAAVIIQNNKAKQTEKAPAAPSPATEGNTVSSSSLSTMKNSDKVAQAFQKIYKRLPLTWPNMLQVDPGREFMGAVTKEMENHKTYILRGHTEIHRNQAIVERFNCTMAERLFGHQYAVEMRLPAGQRSTAWVKRLPEVVAALNNEVTSLTGKKPAEAIKEKAVAAKPSTTYSRPVGEREKSSPPS